MSSIFNIPRARIQQLCRDLCDRCGRGHFSWLDESGRYSHGTDESAQGSGVWIPPDDVIHCEHGIADGEYCEVCSKEYKRAAREAGHES